MLRTPFEKTKKIDLLFRPKKNISEIKRHYKSGPKGTPGHRGLQSFRPLVPDLRRSVCQWRLWAVRGHPLVVAVAGKSHSIDRFRVLA